MYDFAEKLRLTGTFCPKNNPFVFFENFVLEIFLIFHVKL